MNLVSTLYIFVGGTLGLFLRLFIKHNFRKKIGLNINYSFIVNILSSLFLGVLVALSITNKNLYYLFFVGFLGCFSTFSSFIYQLFDLIKNKKYINCLIHYIVVLGLSFLFFCAGQFIILIFKN